DPDQQAQIRQSRGLSQRTADERPAADAVPGATLQPARGQYLDRARRHRLLAHVHGRGGGGRRRGTHRAHAHHRRTKRTGAGGRIAQRRAQGFAAALRQRRTHVAWRFSAGLGALGAFWVLEARGHAEARNAKPLARLSGVLSERSGRPAGAVTAALARMWQRLARPPAPHGIAVISGATGTQPATSEERAWLKTMPDVPVRATGSVLGHGVGPQATRWPPLRSVAKSCSRRWTPPASNGSMKARSSASRSPPWATGAARAWRWSRRGREGGLGGSGREWAGGRGGDREGAHALALGRERGSRGATPRR